MTQVFSNPPFPSRTGGSSARSDVREGLVTEPTAPAEPQLAFDSRCFLGLERDRRLLRAATTATAAYGTQFASPTCDDALSQRRRLERELGRVFDRPTVVATSAVTAHLAALPALLRPGDLLLLDPYAPREIQVAAAALRIDGVRIAFVARTDLGGIAQAARDHGADLAWRDEGRTLSPRVWYAFDAIDGWGSDASLAALAALASETPLALYVEDSLGVSWTGTHGRGRALEHLATEKSATAVVVASLRDGFAAEGAAIVCPDAATRRRIVEAQSPLLAESLSPAGLAAGLASASLHLSTDIGRLQAELGARAALFDRLASEAALPAPICGTGPIRFVAAGSAGDACALAVRLRERGIRVQGSVLPIGGDETRAGIRIYLTRHHGRHAVAELVDALASELRPTPADRPTYTQMPGTIAPPSATAELAREPRARRGAPEPARARGLSLESADSIRAVDREAWNAQVGCATGATAELLDWIESAADGDDPIGLHYVTIRDGAGRCVLRACFSERRRGRGDPGDALYGHVRTLELGHPLCPGTPLHLDATGDPRAVLAVLRQHLLALCERRGIAELRLARLATPCEAVDSALRGLGLESAADRSGLYVALDTAGPGLEMLPFRARRFQRRHVEPFRERYAVDLADTLDDATLREVTRVYQATRAEWLELEHPPISAAGFADARAIDGLELVVLRDARSASRRLAGFVLLHRHPARASLLALGARSDRVYLQCLREAVARGFAGGQTIVELGPGDAETKRRFGATERTLRQYVLRRHVSPEGLYLPESPPLDPTGAASRRGEAPGGTARAGHPLAPSERVPAPSAPDRSGDDAA